MTRKILKYLLYINAKFFALLCFFEFVIEVAIRAKFVVHLLFLAITKDIVNNAFGKDEFSFHD